MAKTLKDLQTAKDSIYDIIETYGLNFGEVCGIFEEIKFELLSDFYGEE